jgi:release factor glutamine methyltransferase
VGGRAGVARSLSVIVAALRAAGCVYAEDEARLLMSAARSPAELSEMVQRRSNGEPLEYVLGWAEFCGLRMAVDPGVFIPRRRTEFLVRQAIGLVRSEAIVVDLCCGSGAVGLAIAAARDQVELHAVDVDPSAVRCARRNLGDAGEVYEGDLYAALPASLQNRVDVFVANAPYVPTAEITLLPAEARNYESRMTLDGGRDGLDIVRGIVADATRWLAAGGHVLVETSDRQAPRVVELMARYELVPRVAISEDLDATVVIGGVGRPVTGVFKTVE